ncbi:restriction endonuclease subunit S [Vibrio splendidus]
MSNSITSPFGELPSDWVYQPVVNYVEFLTGPAFDSTKFNTERFGARLVRGINLTRGATRWAEEKTKYWNVNLEELKKFQLAEMDILIGMDGSLVGKNYAYLKKSDLPALLVQRVARLRAKEQLDSKYLYYMYGTDSWVDYVEIVKTSSGIPHISNGDIKNFLFPSPPLPEQKKIAAILTSVDDVIEKTQAQIDKLKDLKTGMMQELLTRGVGVDGKPHTEFKDSPVGRIPKGWEAVTLGDITEESVFGPRFSSNEYAIDGNIGCIRTTDMDENWDINYSTAPRAKLNHQEFEKHFLRDGDLLVTRSGTCGLVDVFKKQSLPMVAAAFLIRFRLITSVNPYFVRYLMMSSSIQESVQLLASGGVQKNLSGTSLKTLKLPMPSAEEQNQVVNAIESINQSIASVQRKQSANKVLKKALMQDLLTGKKRVKVDS